MQKTLRRIYLYLTIINCGAIIMALEILGTRIVAPYYGVDLYVWASLISITLISLSIGYYLGGVIADRIPKEIILYLILLLIGIFSLLIPLLSEFVLTGCEGLGLKLGTLVSAFILFALPLTLLGIVLPFCIKLEAKALEKIGITVGKLYALSTLGSIIGTLGVAFWFIPNYGISKGFVILGFYLLMLGVIGIIINRRFGLRVLVLIIIIATVYLISFFLLEKPAELPEGLHLTYKIESPYSNLKVIDKDSHSQRFLLSNNIFQTGITRLPFFWNKGCLILSRNYLELLPYYNPEGRQLLLIGLGGGLIPRVMDLHNITTSSIEIDPEVVNIARQFFDFKGEARIGDGRYLLKEDCATGKQYDFIILDAFSSESLPFHLMSKEMFELSKKAIRQNGILAIHYVGTPASIVSQSIFRTLASVFEYVIVYQTGVGDEMQELYFLASGQALELHSRNLLEKDFKFTGNEVARIEQNKGIIITDDYNPLDMENAPTTEIWRKTARFRY